MKQDPSEIIAGMDSLLMDDESFIKELEAKLDFAAQIKERNERLAAKARRMVLRSILLGLLGALLVILTLPVLCSAGPSSFSVPAAIMAACLSSLATLAFSLSSRFE